MERVNCNNCGKDNNTNSKYCSECGYELPKIEARKSNNTLELKAVEINKMKNLQTSLSGNKNTLDQKSTAIFVKLEEINEDNEKVYNSRVINHSKVFVLPSIKTRYFSTLIDGIVIVLLFIGVTTILQKYEQVPDYVRITMLCAISIFAVFL